MSQFGTNVPGSPGNGKNADVTNGSATVILNGIDATSYIDAGDLFNAQNDIVSYEISGVSFNSPDTTVTLVESYQGASGTGVDFLVNRAFTTNRKYALPEQGDIRGLLAVRRALIDIDSDFAGFNPRGSYDSNATYNKLDFVSASDGNSYVAEVDGLSGDAPPSNNWTLLVSGITWRTGSGAPSDSLGDNNDFYIDNDTGDLYEKDSGSYSVVANISGELWFTASGAPSSSTGSNGDLYLDTSNGDVYEKSGGSWSVIGNITGPQGPKGDEWFTGSGTPASSTGENGDLYLDTSNGDVYEKSGGSWSKVGNIQGAVWLNGSGAPASGDGDDGDFYLDTSNGDVYKKSSGSWAVVSNIQGSIWFDGSGAPSSSTGDNGDFYLDVGNGDVYKKSGGSWSVVGNIEGPTGPQGDSTQWIDGSGAPSDSTGENGDFYLDVDSGDVYEKASGSWSLVGNIHGSEWFEGSGAPSSTLGDNGDFYLDNDTGDVYTKSGGSWSATTNIQGPSGSTITLDLGDDGANESTDLTEIATSGDTNSIFTESSADKLLIDLSKNWPTADDVPDSAIDHNATTNYVANEHVDHSAVTVTGGSGLSGGGDLTASRTIALNAGIADLNDAALPNATAAGQVAIWNATNAQFENATITAGSGTTITNGDAAITVAADVESVAGKTGAVTLSTGDVSEGTNLYYTDERVDDRVNGLLVGGTNISLSYDDTNGALTIDGPTVPVDSVAGKTGAVTLGSSDVGLGNVPNEDATDMYNWDQRGASDGDVLTWVNANSRYEPKAPSGGGGLLQYDEFTAGGTWNKASGATLVYVELISGGGGGGNTTDGKSTAGGGAGGLFSSRLFRASDLGSSESVSVGAGGAGGSNGNAQDGGDGGDSSFGSYVTARGSEGGENASSGARGGSAGARGVAATDTDRGAENLAGLGGGINNSMPMGNGNAFGGGGGGGGGSEEVRGGHGLNGGGGGGAANAEKSLSGSGGLSVNAGDGGDGNASSSTAAGNGSFPGGGGGGSVNDGGGGDGAGGRVRVWQW